MNMDVLSSLDSKYDHLLDDCFDRQSQCEDLSTAAERLGQLLHRFSVTEEEEEGRQISSSATEYKKFSQDEIHEFFHKERLQPIDVFIGCRRTLIQSQADEQMSGHHNAANKLNYIEEVILAKIIRQMANELVEQKESQILEQQVFQQRKISTNVVREFYSVWGRYAMLCEEIDWVVLAEGILFLSKIKRVLRSPQEKGSQEDVKEMTDAFRIAYKSATAYAIKQIASNRDTRVSNLFRDLLGEWVMLEAEVSMVAEKKSIAMKASQEYYSRMERVVYDERAEQNRLDYQMINTSQQYESNEEVIVKIEDNSYQYDTPQKLTQLYENSEENSEISMEETGTQEGEQSTKKLKILLKNKSISKSNILKNTSKKQRTLIQSLYDQRASLQKTTIIQQKQQQKTVSWEQSPFCNSELQETNNSYPQDPHQLQLSTISQSTAQSKNASPQTWHFESKISAIPDQQNTHFSQQEEKDSNPISYDKNGEQCQHPSIVDDLFSQEGIQQLKSQKIISEEESLKSWDEVYMYEDDYSNKSSEKETIREVQEEQQESEISNKLHNSPKQNDRQNTEPRPEKPKIDLSIEVGPSFFNSPSPINNSTERQTQAEQEDIFQEEEEDQCNREDLFPNGQDNLIPKYSSLGQKDETKQLSASADNKFSQGKDEQMSQQIFQENDDNESNMQQQVNEEMKDFQDANNSDQAAQDKSKTPSQMNSEEDQEKNCEVPQTFYANRFSKGFGDVEYDLMISLQMEQDIESIRAEEGECSALEVSTQREAREKMFQQQNKFALKLEQMNNLQKRRQEKLSEKLTHKEKLQRHYGLRSIRADLLQESLEVNQLKDRINLRRNGFQKPTNSAYQFDSDLEKSPVKESAEIDNSYIKKLTVIELEDEINLLLLTSAGVVFLLRDCNHLKEIQSLNQTIESKEISNDTKIQTQIESWRNKSQRLNVDGVVDEIIFSTKLSKLLCKCQDGSLKIYQLNLISPQSTNSNIFIFGNSKTKELTKNRTLPKQKAQVTWICTLDSFIKHMSLIEDHSAVAVYGKDLQLKYCHLGSSCLQEFQIAQGDPGLPRITEKQQVSEDSTEKQLLIPFFIYNPELNLLLVSESETAVILYDVSQQQQEQSQLLLLDRKQQFSITLQLKIKYKLECGSIGNIKCLTFFNSEIKNPESVISIKGAQSLVNQNYIANPKLLIGNDSSILALWDLNTSCKLNSTDLKSVPLELVSGKQVVIRNEHNVLVLPEDDLGLVTERVISEQKEPVTITGIDLIRSLNLVAVATKQGQISLIEI